MLYIDQVVHGVDPKVLMGLPPPPRAAPPTQGPAPHELQASLARLVVSELVFQRGMPPHAVYSFKHALVQDAAHDSLLHSSSALSMCRSAP